MRSLLRLPAVLTFALLGAGAAAAAAPQPWKPAKPLPEPPARPAPKLWHGQPIHYVDGVPDTGQFLPDTAVLGRVNDRVFHVRDFRDGWFGSLAEYRPRPDSSGR